MRTHLCLTQKKLHRYRGAVLARHVRSGDCRLIFVPHFPTVIAGYLVEVWQVLAGLAVGSEPADLCELEGTQ
jgi:hypothetical protein